MLIVLLFVFAYFSWKKPFWALGFILASLPLYQVRFQIFIPLTFLEIEILVFSFVNLLRYLIKKEKILFPNKLTSYLIIAFLIVATLAVFLAPNKQTAAGFWKAYFVEPILLTLVVFNLVHSKKDLIFLIKSLCFGLFWTGLWAIGQKFFGGGVMSTEIWGEPEIWRATGPFPHPNFLGLYLGPILLLCLVLFFEEKRKSWFYLIIFLIGLIALFLARSEGAILAVIFSSLLFLFFAGKKARKISLCFLVVILILFSLNIFNLRDKIILKVTLKDLSGQLRLNIWQGAFKMIKASPFFGFGLGGYQELAPVYQENYYHPISGELISVETHPYPHNLFLSFYLELGFFGFLIFCLIIGLFFSQSFSLLKKGNYFLLLGIILSMLVILIHGLVDTPYFKNDLSLLFWVIFSFPFILNKILYEKQN